MKKIAIGAKPKGIKPQFSPDSWVSDRKTEEKMKRLTIDVSPGLHRRIKSQCARRGDNMADKIRDLLENEFPEEYQRGQGADNAAH